MPAESRWAGSGLRVPWWYWAMLAVVFVLGATTAGAHTGLRHYLELLGGPLALLAGGLALRQACRQRQHRGDDD